MVVEHSLPEIRYPHLIQQGTGPDEREWLSEKELEIARRLRNRKRSEEWIESRLLAKRLAVKISIVDDPARVSVPTIGERPHLMIDGEQSSYEISLSHSGSFFAAAIAEHPIGIDLQTIRPIRDGALHFFLSAEECSELDRTSLPHARVHYWVAKEAAFKFDVSSRIYKDVALKLMEEKEEGLELSFFGPEGEGTVVTRLWNRELVIGWSL